jgi:hypothetical protein
MALLGLIYGPDYVESGVVFLSVSFGRAVYNDRARLTNKGSDPTRCPANVPTNPYRGEGMSIKPT